MNLAHLACPPDERANRPNFKEPLSPRQLSCLFFTTCAGLPATTVQGSTFFIATARAPTMAPSPTVTPGPTKASANPDLVLNDNRRFDQRQIQLSVIVRAGAKLRSMRDGDFFPERYLAEVVNEGVLANRAPIPHGKVPRKIHPRGWIGVDVGPDFGAETA